MPSPPHQLTLLCVFVLTWCLSAASVSSGTENDDDTLTLDSLKSHWTQQQAAIKSAVIRYRYTFRVASPKQERENVLKLLERVDLLKDQDRKTLVTSLDGTLLGKDELWSTSVFTLRSPDARDDSTSDKRISSHVRIGAHELWSRPVTTDGQLQVDIWPRGGSRLAMRSIADFNKLPHPNFAKLATVASRDVIDDAQRVELQYENTKIIAGAETGFVFEFMFDDRMRTSGEDVFQIKPKSHSNGVTLPTIIFRGRYQLNKLQAFSLLTIDSVVLNEPVPDAAFLVPAIAGDVIVDYRTKPHEVNTVVRATEDVLNDNWK